MFFRHSRETKARENAPSGASREPLNCQSTELFIWRMGPARTGFPIHSEKAPCSEPKRVHRPMIPSPKRAQHSDWFPGGIQARRSRQFLHGTGRTNAKFRAGTGRTVRLVRPTWMQPPRCSEPERAPTTAADFAHGPRGSVSAADFAGRRSSRREGLA
jgi:hypothetical protein